MEEITPKELAEILKTAEPRPLLIDVRSEQEYNICHIDGSQHIPMNQIPEASEKLDPEEETIIICHHGIRSAQVASFLEQTGFAKVGNLAGGIDAWAVEIDPSMPRY